MAFQFKNTGAAINSALYQFLHQLETRRAMEREARWRARAADTEEALNRAQLARAQQDAANAAEDRRTRRALQAAEMTEPGTVLDDATAETIGAAFPGMIAAERSLPSRSLTMSVDPTNRNALQVPGVIAESRPTGRSVYRGTPDQRAQAQAAETKREDIIRQRERVNALLADPNTPPHVKSFIRTQIATGDNDIPAALFEPTKPDTRSLQAQANDAHARGDMGEYQRLLGVIRDTGRADDRPQVLQLTDGGFSPRQVVTFNQIAGAYERSPLIRAADRTIVLSDAVKAIRRDPQNPANQMSLAYGYIQALDTYQSAVREGELQNLGALGTRLQQLGVEANRIATTGAFMPPDVAREIADSAEQLVRTIESGRKRKQQEFASRARVSGVGEMWGQFAAGFGDGGDGSRESNTVTLRDPSTGATRTVERNSVQYRAYTAAGAEEVR